MMKFIPKLLRLAQCFYEVALSFWRHIFDHFLKSHPPGFQICSWLHKAHCSISEGRTDQLQIGSCQFGIYKRFEERSFSQAFWHSHRQSEDQQFLASQLVGLKLLKHALEPLGSSADLYGAGLSPPPARMIAFWGPWWRQLVSSRGLDRCGGYFRDELTDAFWTAPCAPSWLTKQLELNCCSSGAQATHLNRPSSVSDEWYWDLLLVVAHLSQERRHHGLKFAPVRLLLLPIAEDTSFSEDSIPAAFWNIAWELRIAGILLDNTGDNSRDGSVASSIWRIGIHSDIFQI